MPSTIILRSPDSITDKRIRLSNSQFGRPFNFGTWSKVRVCFRLGFTDYGASPSGNVNHFLGLCSGTTNMFGDATCQHFVGFGNTGTWTRSGSGSSLIYTAAAPSYYTKIGTTLVASTNASNGIAYGATADFDGKQRKVLFVEYVKLSGTQMNLTAFYRLNNAGTVDISYSDWLNLAEVETGAAYTLHAWGTTRTLSVNEGVNGVLDAVTAYWSRTSPQMEISDIAVVKFA